MTVFGTAMGVAIVASVDEVMKLFNMGLKTVFSAWPLAVILIYAAAAILFGVYHGSLLQGVYACALGILIGWSYERFKNIFAPILLHMSANAMSLAMTKWTVLNDFFGKTPIRLGLTVIFFGIFCSFFCRLLEKYSKEF